MKINLARMFAYRINFINSFIASATWSFFNIISLMLLTSKTSQIFGWTRNEILLLAGIYNIIYSIFYLLFSRNFEEFSYTIHFGRLDNILTKPIDSQFLMTCWYIGYGHVVRLLVGSIFTIIILSQMHIQIAILTFVNFLSLLILSIIILYSFWLFVMTLTIWHTRLSNLIDLLYQVNGIMRFPQEMYKRVSIFIFFALFPLTLIIVTPTKALLHKILLGDILWPIIFSLLFFFASRKFWKFALRFYTSASS